MIKRSRHLVLLTIILLVQQGCYLDFEDRGPRYDIRQISVGQQSLFFKREIRGRNYEGLSISSDGDLDSTDAVLAQLAEQPEPNQTAVISLVSNIDEQGKIECREKIRAAGSKNRNLEVLTNKMLKAIN